jgi:hypothetical protein
VKATIQNLALKAGALVAVSCAVLPAFGAGSQVEASKQFHGLLGQALPQNLKAVEAERLHYIVNPTLDSLMSSRSIEDAMKAVASQSLNHLAADTSHLQMAPAPSLDQALAKNPVTIVVIPGIFSEFINVRAFEGVFAKPSAFSKQFQAIVDQQLQKKNAASVDVTLDSSTLKNQNVKLSDVIEAGSIDDASGKPLVKVILFKTKLLSLESVGELDLQMSTFTRRLEKYLKLTGSQKLAFVGYSRGTTTGLAMLSDAQKNRKPWLKDVKAMVSYAGVVSGSTLADDLDNPDSATGQGIKLLKQLQADLIVAGDNASAVERLAAFHKNNMAYLKFGEEAAKLAPKLAPSGNNAPNAGELGGSPNDIDFSSPVKLSAKMFALMGLKNPITTYRKNVARFKLLIGSIVKGVEQLRTVERKAWWKTHMVPTQGITYYSLAATMADPTRSTFERDLFLAPNGYSRSYDDKSLLQNHRDYARISGVVLNDSQVAVPQAMFLPQVIASMNPKQPEMKIANLGVLGTHHWGAALQVVNVMKDGRTNPFPREAVLKALAGQIAIDSAK